MFRSVIQKIFERLAKKYIRKHQPKLVVVTGSVGKTSTKTAIATVLAEKYLVRMHDGNHNTHMSVPLAILGVEYPEDVHSIKAWWVTYQAAKLRIKETTDVNVIIQELGTDHPGDIAHFGTYLHPDIAVVTAVTPEHMEFFGSVEAVAKEELAVAGFSKTTIINRDDIDQSYAQYANTQDIFTYGVSEGAEYRIDFLDANSTEGIMGKFISPEWEPISVNLQVIGVPAIKAATAAGVVAARLGLSSKEIAVGISKFKPVSGRMQLLRGIKDSIVIDDSYNSSPAAAIASLDTLYAMKAEKRIAILGSMNELGKYSEQAHRQVGDYCDPAQLDTLVTVGDEAQKYLAPAAHAKGCQVHSFSSPYDAGGFVNSQLSPGTVVLVKGSQNRVFAEEAVKVLLHDATDETRLVRQSPQWMAVKQEQFERKFSDTDD
jgi:UDP-N-acetylmuramoyl-tripeptide--D-alanyl-D-alanine ligase